jgi:hypothetical protein
LSLNISPIALSRILSQILESLLLEGISPEAFWYIEEKKEPGYKFLHLVKIAHEATLA